MALLTKFENTIYIVVVLSGANSCLAAPDTHVADDGNSLKFYAADTESYDSNLYRLPSDIADISALVGPHADRQEFINTVYAGLDGVWVYGRQSVTLNLRADENRFLHNSNLNSSAGNADVNSNWVVGSRLSGQIGGDYSRSLANFAETLYLGRDLVTSTDTFGTGKYELGPHWSLIGGVRNADSTHSANAASVNNFQTQSGNVGLELTSDSTDTLTWEYRYTIGHFPDGIFILNDEPFDRDYNENTINFIVNRNISDKTQVSASIGYDKRNYAREALGAFSGDIWRVSVQWQLTEKTQIVAATWRDLESYLAAQSNYFISTGASFSPTWSATEKLSFSLSASSIQQKYIPSSPTVVTLGTRTDRLNDEQASMIYTPRRNVTLNVSFHNELRSSNEAIFRFSDRFSSATFSYRF